MRTRERIHDLVDKQSDRQLPAVDQFLEKFSTGGSPFRRELATVPVEREPLTPDDVAAIDEGYVDIADWRSVSDDELRRRSGHDSPR